MALCPLWSDPMIAEARWTIPLEGVCDVCAQPALRLTVYDTYRVIVHDNAVRPCVIANPGPPVHGPTGYYEPPYKRKSTR